jgi:hypothetical protein
MYSSSVDAGVTFSCGLNDGLFVCCGCVVAVFGTGPDGNATFRGFAPGHDLLSTSFDLAIFQVLMTAGSHSSLDATRLVKPEHEGIS